MIRMRGWGLSSSQYFPDARTSDVGLQGQVPFYPPQSGSYTGMNVGEDLYGRSDTVGGTEQQSSSWHLVKKQRTIKT